MYTVGVVVLNFKVADLAIKAIQSVKKSSFVHIKIYAVDNDSKDGFEENVKKIDNVVFIQTGANLGYTGGNNVGIKRALEDGCEWVFLLNPDAVVEKETIETLVERAEKNSAQIVNPKIYFADSKIIWFAGKEFDQLNVLGHHRGVDEQDVGKYDTEEELEDGTGCAMLIHKQVFEKIGMLDERYFLYYEESDFCFRARKAGFKIMYIPKAVVYHDNAKSTGLGSPLQDYFITRNRMLFASKFLPFRTQFALIREALRTGFKYPTRRLALMDYLMGRFGKGSFLK
jgi:GT2 family glycosyltransferase